MYTFQLSWKVSSAVPCLSACLHGVDHERTLNDVDIEINGFQAGLHPHQSTSSTKMTKRKWYKGQTVKYEAADILRIWTIRVPVMHWKISLELNAAAHNMTTRKMTILLSKKRMKTRVKPLSSSLQMVSNTIILKVHVYHCQRMSVPGFGKRCLQAYGLGNLHDLTPIEAQVCPLLAGRDGQYIERVHRCASS